MKKIILTGIVYIGLYLPTQAYADTLLERVVTEVILGVFDEPRYKDQRPYYFYDNRYYYGGDWRDGYYYYEGKRLHGGRYYERGYYDHYQRKYYYYDRPKYIDERPYYFYKNRYYYGGEWRNGYYYYNGIRLVGGRYYRQGYHEQFG
jgi:hypothetical protein